MPLQPDFFSELASLSPKAQREVFAGLGKKEFDRCAESPTYWLDVSKHPRTEKYPEGIPYVFTKDPHQFFTCNVCGIEVIPQKRGLHLSLVHQTNLRHLREIEKQFTLVPAVRPFPNELFKEYMIPLIENWVQAQYFVIEKSRDMMATWLMVALHTWDVLFHHGRQHLFQSKVAPDSLELVERAYFIAKKQPKFLRDQIGPVECNKGDHRSGEMFVLKQESEILGFAQGPDVIRQLHPSGVFVDEAAFQIEAESAFAAIKPAILMGGRFTAISSANRSWFEKICRDTSDN